MLGGSWAGGRSAFSEGFRGRVCCIFFGFQGVGCVMFEAYGCMVHTCFFGLGCMLHVFESVWFRFVA